MKRLRILTIAIAVAFACSACATHTDNQPEQAVVNDISPVAQINIATVGRPVVPVGSGAAPGAWNVGGFPGSSGLIAPVAAAHGWQPMNFGVQPPILAANARGTAFMATAAGVWMRSGIRWALLPDSESLGQVVSLVVTPAGAPIVATSQHIYIYKDGAWRDVARNQQVQPQSLTWDPAGRLIAVVTLPVQQKVGASPNGTVQQGPGPLPPHYATIALAGTHWVRIDNTGAFAARKDISHIAWSTTGQVAVASTSQGLSTLAQGAWMRIRFAHSDAMAGQQANVNAFVWDGASLLVATDQAGLWKVVGHDVQPINGLPDAIARGHIVQLTHIGHDVVAVVQGATNNASMWIRRNGVWHPYGPSFAGVHDLDASAGHDFTVELADSVDAHRALWQWTGSAWQVLDMSTFPARVFGPDAYVESHDLAWWRNALAVSSGNAVVVWNGSTWNVIGGTNNPLHADDTGTIVSTVDGTLFARVRETIPPPPTTPSQTFDTLWFFRQKQWHQLALPKPHPGRVIDDPVVAPDGTIAALESGAPTGEHIWLYQHGAWKEIADGTGVFANSEIGEPVFAANGDVTVDVQQPMTGGAVDNIYEWNGFHWTPLLQDNSVVAANTYWFHYAWAPDGSIVIGKMGTAGYSLWHYTNKHWVNLGLDGQMPQTIEVLGDNTLFVVTDAYVCWHLQL